MPTTTSVAPVPPAPIAIVPPAPASVIGINELAKVLADKSNELGGGEAVHAIVASFGKGPKISSFTQDEMQACKTQVEAL